MRILVVEDEHKIASSIKRGLEQENYAVDVAYDGTEGFDLAASEPYDAIVLDRLLPGIEGAKIAAKLREQQIHTPVIMLTAKGQQSDRDWAISVGTDYFLTKPFSPIELFNLIEKILSKSKVED